MQQAVRNPRQKKVETTDDLEIRQKLESLKIPVPEETEFQAEIITSFPKLATPHSPGGVRGRRVKEFTDANSFADWATQNECIVEASGSSIIWEEIPRDAFIRMAQYNYSQFDW